MKFSMKCALVAPTLAVAMLVGGCDKGPSGIYKAEGPVPFTVEFKSGKAVFSMMGETKESDYTVSGDKISVAKDPEGKPVTMTLNSDGSLTGPGGVKFVKAK